LTARKVRWHGKFAKRQRTRPVKSHSGSHFKYPIRCLIDSVSGMQIQAEACGYGSELSKMWKRDGWSPKERVEF